MGILISIIIGISLLAFILTDFLSSGKSVFGRKQFEVAEISGKTVNVKEFEEKIHNLEEVYKFQSGQPNLNEESMQGIREQVWQEIVEEGVLEEECKELSLEVSPKEVLDMVEGANPHPIIKQLFTNPETKTLNRAGIIQFIKSLDKESDAGKRAFWIYVEKQISRERLLTKYNNLLKNGIYVTSFQANADAKESDKKANFNFIAEKLNSISDSAVKITEPELKKYYKAHSAEYDQEASRDLEYITYDIVPSQEDFDQAKKWIDNIKAEFEASTEIKQFVSLNSDAPFNEKYLKQSELPDTLRSLMFKSKVGTTYGPYFENSTFKIARLADIKNLPDSVRARHILLQPENKTKEAYAKTKSTADSLLKVLKKGGKGVKFEQLALQYSKDGTANKGGDLGWFKEGAMVKPFNDACFNGKKGDLVVVESQFGIHVIEITDKGKEVKKVQVGILERKVEASNITIQAIYQKASAFAGSNNTGEKFSSCLEKRKYVA